MTRRRFLFHSGLALGAALTATRSSGVEMPVLEVAYAGSMASLMEGPLKTAVAQKLGLQFRGRAQGSNALAELIVGGSIRPDVFVAVTPGPMLTVLRAGKAESAQPIARTEMVIAYSPKSRFAAKLEAAARAQGNWWETLQEPGFRFGRTDPVADPQGRNIIFTFMLAAEFYRQPNLVDKTLGPTINSQQIFTEPTVQARLQSGELDAASAYKVQPGPFRLPYVTLPKEINLSGEDLQAKHPEVTLSLNGKVYRPESLIYYAAALKDAPNRDGSAKFVEWLKGEQMQGILRSYNYDPPGAASALHA